MGWSRLYGDVGVSVGVMEIGADNLGVQYIN
jgi:hypothetical protein